MIKIGQPKKNMNLKKKRTKKEKKTLQNKTKIVDFNQNSFFNLKKIQQKKLNQHILIKKKFIYI